MTTPPTPDTGPERLLLPATGACIAEKYELIRRIGSGGMGTVWEARHRFTHAHVALKLINPNFAFDAGMIARFLKEARAVTAIGHPNLVRVLDMGPSAYGFYMAQELLVGRDLFEVLAERAAFGPHELWTLLRPIGEALHAAHQVGVIHRDIKPENIFLATTPEGAVTPRLIDFGIAKSVVTGREATHVTAPNQTPGTLAYMAPEQHLGEVELDARVDVWAFGVVLDECLSGAHPFPGETATSVMLSILEGRAAPLSSEIPRDVAAIVERAMAVDRARRPPSMRALIDAMDEALAASPIADGDRSPPLSPMDPSMSARRTVGPHSSLVPVQRPSESGLPPVRSAASMRSIKALGVGLVAAALALLVGALLSRRGLVPPARATSPSAVHPVAPPLTTIAPPPPLPLVEVDAGLRAAPPPPPPPAVAAPSPRPARVGSPGARRTTTSPLGVQDQYE